VVIDDVSDTRHKKDGAARRQIKKVAKVLCELRTEKMRRSGFDVPIFNIRVDSIYERSDLFVPGRRQR